MNEKEAFPLVKKLLQKTADKKIPWEATADEHTFILPSKAILSGLCVTELLSGSSPTRPL